MNSVTFKRKLFGGEISIIVYNPPKNIKDAIDKTYSKALRLQKIFNFFDEESELSKLNKNRSMKVSKELLEVLKKSLKFSRLTGGKYDPTLGKQILQRKTQKEENKLNCSYRDIKISFGRVSLKHPDIMIDLGSIAKGYITDKVADFLKAEGIKSFIINSRGDIIFSGDLGHIIGIENPRKPGTSIMKIKIKNQCIATSGDYRQFYGKHEKSHILNSNDAISITVLANKLENADVIATSLFVSDDNERSRIIKKFKDCKIMILKEDLKPRYYNNFQEIIKE